MVSRALVRNSKGFDSLLEQLRHSIWRLVVDKAAKIEEKCCRGAGAYIVSWYFCGSDLVCSIRETCVLSR